MPAVGASVDHQNTANPPRLLICFFCSLRLAEKEEAPLKLGHFYRSAAFLVRLNPPLQDIGCPQRVNPHTENAQKIPTRVTLSCAHRNLSVWNFFFFFFLNFRDTCWLGRFGSIRLLSSFSQFISCSSDEAMNEPTQSALTNNFFFWNSFTESVALLRLLATNKSPPPLSTESNGNS